MPPVRYESITALEDNSTEMYMLSTEVLVRIARNILTEPENPKYRSLSLGSNVVTSKLLPASGAMQCLFDMGFQEGSDKLILPPGSSLDCIKYIHDELLRRRALRTSKKPEPNKIKPITNTIIPNPKLQSIGIELSKYILPIQNSFFNQILPKILNVWKCEKISLQLKALKCIPLTELKKNTERNIRKIEKLIKKKEIDDQYIDSEELLLLEVCKWFRNSFFTWVNNPECTKCGNKDTVFVLRDHYELLKKLSAENEGVHSVEVYSCPACKETVLFPRYGVEKLLETRRGRCGEWAQCFYLICRSIGWDVRYICDETDHVWVEVYSNSKNRWIHCDPCETIIDSPLIYECGWKKNLSYVIAYSKDEIQDVTWRYSSNHANVLKNRRNCTEEQLVDLICNVRRILLSFASESRREFVTKRAALESVELMVQKQPTEADKQGRSSGSLAWRLARGEISLQEDFKPFTWRLESSDTISYCTSSDEYTSECSGKMIKGWRNGLYKVDSIFRKDEFDWKMSYLAREEGSSKGTLTWKFETGNGLAIGEIQLQLVQKIYETGNVMAKMCNDLTCVIIPKGDNSFKTGDFKGSKSVELSVELSGGNSWQHAQLLRQPFGEQDKTFQITINLIPA